MRSSRRLHSPAAPWSIVDCTSLNAAIKEAEAVLAKRRKETPEHHKLRYRDPR
jgi:hypothetical protein